MKSIIKIVSAVSILVMPLLSFSQTGSVKGTIKTSDGQPAEFVDVALKGISKGTITNSKGAYEIKNVNAGKYILIASFVGLETQEADVEVKAGETTNAPDIILKENAQQLQDVTVSAQRKKYGDTIASQSLRINTPLIETPQNISIVTRTTMKDFGINGTGDMSRLVSGVSKWYGGANDFSFLIRGTDATNNNFRDGIGGYWWNQQADAFMLEKVEFVKGPAGFMIGNAEPGGVYNEVTKQADGKKTRELELGYGSFNLMRAGADVGGKFSEKSKFSYRLVAGAQYTNAYYDFYKSHRLYAMPSLRFTYGEGSNIQIEYTGMLGFQNNIALGQVSLDGHNYLYNPKLNASEPDILNGIYNEDSYLRISHTHQFKNGWHLKTQFADAHGRFDGDGLYSSAYTPDFDTMYREYYYVNQRSFLTAAQSFVDGKFKTGNKIEHSFLTGIDYGNSWLNSIGAGYNLDNYGANLPFTPHNPQYKNVPADLHDLTNYDDSKKSTKWLAWYGQDHIKFYDKIILTVAGRFSYTEAKSTYDDSSTVYNSTFTPRFGITYLINKNMSVYVLYDQSFLPQIARLENGKLPNPLTGSNKEIGYKAQLLQDRLFINASIWHTEKNNVLVQNPQTTYYEQRGQITSQGFEISAMGSISKTITANVNYTYLDAKITKDATPENIGYRNASTAKHTANAMLIYHVNKGKLSGLSAGAGLQFIGDMYVAYPGFTAAEDKDKKAPAYTLFDVNVAYEISKFSFHVNVYNLFNKRYMIYPYWNSAIEGGTPGYYTLTPGDPANFRISVNYRF